VEPADPIAQIVADRQRARAAGDAFADLCVLATADGPGPPALRTLVLRDVGPQGVGLLVSSRSPKWGPLEAGRYECLLVWLAIRRQYRIRGRLAPMPAGRLGDYWRQKGHASQLLDHYYESEAPQSSPVASREAFLAGIERLRRRHPGPGEIPPPAPLRGVYLVPDRVEAWRGSPDRLHDRRLYVRRGAGPAAGWTETVLVP
jgi:pyridoxamine 5'-phosphate oxidase